MEEDLERRPRLPLGQARRPELPRSDLRLPGGGRGQRGVLAHLVASQRRLTRALQRRPAFTAGRSHNHRGARPPARVHGNGTASVGRSDSVPRPRVALLRVRPFGRCAPPGASGASRPLKAASWQPVFRSVPAGAHADPNRMAVHLTSRLACRHSPSQGRIAHIHNGRHIAASVRLHIAWTAMNSRSAGVISPADTEFGTWHQPT